MSDEVLFEASGGTARITLNRPERLNAMNSELLELLLEAVETAASDDSITVVILTGAGKGFCAGGDIKEGLAIRGGDIEGDIRHLRTLMRSAQLLHEMPKVTIAAVNGACAGAGFSLACACDLRYAARSAVFTTAFVTVGLSGDFGGTWTLPRIVGSARACELYLLSEKIDALEAERVGLVSRTLEDKALMGHVGEVAARLRSLPSGALKSAKANLNDAGGSSFVEQLDDEARRHIQCSRTEDAREAVQAFIEKRQPRFTGR